MGTVLDETKSGKDEHPASGDNEELGEDSRLEMAGAAKVDETHGKARPNASLGEYPGPAKRQNRTKKQ